MHTVLFKGIIRTSQSEDRHKKEVEFLHPRYSEGARGMLEIITTSLNETQDRHTYHVSIDLPRRYRPNGSFPSSISFYVDGPTGQPLTGGSLGCTVLSKSGELRYVQKIRLDADTDLLTFYA